MSSLLQALERLEELMRRYEGRKDASGATQRLSEDIKMASLEALLPDELERHVMRFDGNSRCLGIERLQAAEGEIQAALRLQGTSEYTKGVQSRRFFQSTLSRHSVAQDQAGGRGGGGGGGRGGGGGWRHR